MRCLIDASQWDADDIELAPDESHHLIQVLRARGCGNIIAVDIEPGRLHLANDLGADFTLTPSEYLPGEVAKLTGGRGADVAFEVVGMTPTLLLASTSAFTRPGWSNASSMAMRPPIEKPRKKPSFTSMAFINW